jgi:hypothetical protein
VTEGHARRAPKSDDEPQIKRMTDHLVKGRRLERYRLCGSALEVVVNLL